MSPSSSVWQDSDHLIHVPSFVDSDALCQHLQDLLSWFLCLTHPKHQPQITFSVLHSCFPKSSQLESDSGTCSAPRTHLGAGS